MDKIFKTLRAVVTALRSPATPADPLARMSLREFADLPATHPRRDA
ncbi:MAG: hypothetical protein WDN31_11955 [Hyphomicrobium sp.]